ncbi:MAG: ABC transporter permease [Caldilineaceae bacterium]|nr:ABC transporter permease [Caldilineaceae bacterium]MCB9161244.1 ABC transporter permease [Caldilineaceae bacterium]MCB9162623.1 ABC transporter permease [Caldilineaceae bacterium]
MASYIIRRVLAGVVTIWAATVITFVVIQLPPGDFVTAYIANLQSTGTILSTAEAESLRIQYGLDRPIHVQYAKWMGLMLKGNFGMAMEYNRPVREVIGDRMLITIIVSLAAVLFIWVLALPIGIYSAVRQYSIGDYVFTFIGFIGIAIPNFMLALIVLYVSFKYFDVQNIGGLFSPEMAMEPWGWPKIWDMMKHLPIPAVIIGMAGMAEVVRIMRANLLDELRKPYVVTARAKGLPQHRVIMKYPVRAAMNPFASTIGYLFPFLVSGSIIVSLVLSLPTVGPLLYKSLIAQDLFLAGTILLMLAVLTVVGTFISDLILMWIDPRIRFGMEGRN